MVWLEDGDAAYLPPPAQLFPMIRDGAPTSVLVRPTVGFRVTHEYTSPSLNREFFPGMQGRVLLVEEDSAYVECRDLFQTDKTFLKDWISLKAIKMGTKLYGTWEIDTCNIPRTISKLTANEAGALRSSKYQHLALGISTFLKVLVDTHPGSLTDDSFAKLGKAGSNIPYLTANVIIGIERAGLANILNKPDFTVQDLVSKATLNCSKVEEAHQSGFYFRCYITTPKPNQNACSLYVGQSHDLYNRYHGWKQGGHEELIEKSHSIEMRALCLVDPSFYQDNKYIIEQLFTSLLQTYKEALTGVAGQLNEDQINFHKKNHSEMDKVAKAAAKLSKWTGAVQRDSFWKASFATCAGLNYQSPISEAPTHEPSVWLRQDGWMPNVDDPTESIKIANFTREVPKKMTVLIPGKTSASQDKSFIIFALVSDVNKDYRFRINRTLPGGPSSDGVEWPAEGSFFNVTFEVRLDWKPHPFSWARLPLVGPFQDWDRANSWAISINWEDAGGNHRSKYLHCERPLKMVHSDEPGSFTPYANGIEVIHWLFNERIPADQQHSWLRTPPMAAVKVVKYDHVDQMITFEAGTGVTTSAPIPNNRLDPDDIENQLKGLGVHGDFQLRNVGLSQAESRASITRFGGQKLGTRNKCDSCMFLNLNTGLNGSNKCEVKSGKVCENCRVLYGRPVCSWTPGIPAVYHPSQPTGLGNSFKQLEAQGDATNALRRKALNGLPGWTGDGTNDGMVSADPAIVEIDQGNEVEDMEEWDLENALIAAGEQWEVWGGA
ncbi:hypothetical protein HBH56_142540 [Parastagonospora nodorum]|uniref:Uncharacterized protein n=2 Tax=Phaeosphaeria nodorum (strain SN15 / ATCC MYA-4574 / FGSC 10173) TaxID=321614 RepID=A0A7U2I4N6_PHANO|nr:hypothetical protein SNOG_12208 [Parastagonospora nodorum SN15]KAH3910496.1 hypothetical protein HBH56_142540 [Parastagonospora nodorum]EAT80620.1 hypothetical protein SNOG_12208 [Parastagonospora nodorum SN15]KAH3927703.1 hypothetical protein HBH54_147730 [Parastagonospora nodorum]KAH4031525.1 hypothetical protein HBI09_125800 [Parastagonospora nodorum]KAH4048109.1 hypothetical protein HBH49_164450 [Parastagonospora nodorum]